MPKSKYVNLPRSVRVDEEVHEHLNVMAERDHRSVANLIGLLIIEAVENDLAKGDLDKPPRDYAK